MDFMEIIRTPKDNRDNDCQYITGLKTKTVDMEKRRVTGLASTPIIDRDNEIITLEALKAALPEYLKNPVVLAGHQHRLADGSSPVVGSVVSATANKDGLQIICEFARTPLGEEYWALYRDKHQRGFSIGFRAIAAEDQIIEGRRIKLITKLELYEISCVPVPANPEALSKAKQRKLDFVGAKRTNKADPKMEERLAVDRFAGRLELWRDTEDQQDRDKIFTPEERQEFGRFDRKAEEFAKAFLSMDDDDGETMVNEYDFVEAATGKAEHDFAAIFKD